MKSLSIKDQIDEIEIAIRIEENKKRSIEYKKSRKRKMQFYLKNQVKIKSF